MSVPLTINGAVFNYPVNFDTNWGIDATGWAQAVTAGMLQKAGGSFSLTADVDFGDSFGLISQYFTSEAVNPSTVGTLRLSSADPGVGFRNNANSGNLILTTDASDNLLYNGNIIAASAAGPLPVSRGGTGDSSLTAYAVLAGGTSSTTPIQSVASLGLSGQVLTSNGAGMLPTFQTVTGTGTVNSGTANQLAYYATTSATVSGNPNLIYSESFGGTRLNVTDTSGAFLLLTTSTNQMQTSLGAGGVFDIKDVTNGRDIFIYDPTPNTVTLSTPLALGSHKITGLAAGTTNGDAVRYEQTIRSDGSNPFTGNQSLGSNKITNLANGTAAQDAVAFGQLTVNYATAVSAGSSADGTTTLTTKSITTSGGPVLILARAMMFATGNGTFATADCDVTRGGSGIPGAFATWKITTTDTTANGFYIPMFINVVDMPTAGTYTYRLTSNSASTVRYNLVLIELHA
jgi:hypothetical protein